MGSFLVLGKILQNETSINFHCSKIYREMIKIYVSS